MLLYYFEPFAIVFVSPNSLVLLIAKGKKKFGVLNAFNLIIACNLHIDDM